MSDQNPTSPNEETKLAEQAEALVEHQADRPPTTEEEQAAPTAPSSGVAEKAEEMAKLGAEVKGEGELP